MSHDAFGYEVPLPCAAQSDEDDQSNHLVANMRYLLFHKRVLSWKPSRLPRAPQLVGAITGDNHFDSRTLVFICCIADIYANAARSHSFVSQLLARHHGAIVSEAPGFRESAVTRIGIGIDNYDLPLLNDLVLVNELCQRLCAFLPYLEAALFKRQPYARRIRWYL